MQEIVKLEAVLVEPDEGIRSNIAELQRQCLDLAEEFRGATTVSGPDGYKEAKANRAACNAAIKQVEAERKRVKVAWTAPLTTFEASVKGALTPLAEVRDEWDAAIKDYEARAREAKRARLESYWEGAYPALALCTGEDEEPLVPFSRVMDIVGSDWTKRMSEVGEGHDGVALARMDDLAANLADGAATIASLSEPPEVRRAALSELYRTFNVVTAIQRAKAEDRRRRDIDRLGEAQRETGVPAVEAPDEAASGPAPAPVPPALEPAPEPAPGPATGRLRAFDGAPVAYVVEVECADESERARAVEAMRAAGLHGVVRAL